MLSVFLYTMQGSVGQSGVGVNPLALGSFHNAHYHIGAANRHFWQSWKYTIVCDT